MRADLISHAAASASPETIHVVPGWRLRQGMAWQQGRLLSTFSTLGLHRAIGFLSFGRFCRERAGLGIRRARQLIALDRRLVQLPGLSRIYRDGEASWVKASAVARVADESSEHHWIQLARSVTFRRLREETALITGPRGRPDGLASSDEVQVDSPWRLGKTHGTAGDAGVQMCAGATDGDGVQSCARSRSRVRFWAPTTSPICGSTP